MGERFAERFLVKGELGRGGFAVVYEALDERCGDLVALKLLRTDRLGAAALKRFEREAAVARTVASPHLVTVREADTFGEVAWLAMDLMAGGSLAKRLVCAATPVPIDEVLRLAREALLGLAALHGAGLVHRDVKPSNLLLSSDGRLALGDFGLVRRYTAEETRATATSSLVGTLDYLSPEQAMGEELDGRSDLYSLGVVLFELLAGRSLYEGRSGLGSLLARLRDPVPRLEELRPEVPSWLARLVEKLLARDRADRYASATEVLADFEAQRAPARSWRSLRFEPLAGNRGWWLVAAAAAAGLGLVALGAVAATRGGRESFARVVESGPRTVRALDSKGRTLWERTQVRTDRNFVPVRMGAGEPARVVAVEGLAEDSNYPASRTLALVDAWTGRSLERIVLPGSPFYEVADRFDPSLYVVDLNHDGVDEVLATFTHQPYFPSYTILYEPRARRWRTLYVGSGHHRPEAFADLDGDGRAEVLFAGIANRMGWYTALAAVRLSPWLGELERDQAEMPAHSPDRPLAETNSHNLLWFALAPRGFPVNGSAIAVDTARRALTLRFTHGGTEIFSFEGFSTSDPSTAMSPEDRQKQRNTSYADLREAIRRLDLGRTREAVELDERAVAAADRAGDVILGRWARRSLAGARIEAGQVDAGEALFEELAATTEDDADLAFDAGRACALGELPERAATWYRRGLGEGMAAAAGRRPYEFLEGLVLALAQLNRFEEAFAELSRFGESFPEDTTPLSAPYREFLRWWRGELPRPELLESVNIEAHPLFEYWHLELALAAGMALEDVEARFARFAERSRAVEPLRLSLESELARRRGKTEKALSLAREALRRARPGATRDPAIRFHAPLLERRLAAFEEKVR